MTNLITRLRDDYACGLQSRLCEEAADEIDRLRAELQNARNKLKASGPDSWPGAEVARAALGE